MIIYKIQNKINGKVYIGQTKNSIDQRFKQHINKSHRNEHSRLYSAMKKYGVENFEISEIDSVDDNCANAQDLLNEKEIYWISFYNSTGDNGYNILIGGDVNRMCSPLAKDLHDKKMSSLEVRNKISNSLKEYRKNNPFTEEHRKKLSESAKGNHNFGTGDTRSISCFCVDENGERHKFHNIRIAGEWWYENYKPFGDSYSQATFQRKIIDSMNGKRIVYNNRGNKIVVDNIKWFRCKEGDSIE